MCSAVFITIYNISIGIPISFYLRNLRIFWHGWKPEIEEMKYIWIYFTIWMCWLIYMYNISIGMSPGWQPLSAWNRILAVRFTKNIHSTFYMQCRTGILSHIAACTWSKGYIMVGDRSAAVYTIWMAFLVIKMTSECKKQ